MRHDAERTSDGSKKAGSPFEGKPGRNGVNDPCSRHQDHNKRSEKKFWSNHDLSPWKLILSNYQHTNDS